LKDIIEKNRQKIRQIIKSITGEYNEDLEQETYIKTFLNLKSYKELNKFSKWICTICANTCRDYLKSAKRINFNTALSNTDELNTFSAKDNIERELTSKERQKLILRAIDKLPKKLKEVIILYEYEDYSYSQIAKRLKVPEGTVKSRINSARNNLKETLSFLLGDDYE